MSARSEAKRRAKMARRKAQEADRAATRDAAPPLIELPPKPPPHDTPIAASIFGMVAGLIARRGRR